MEVGLIVLADAEDRESRTGSALWAILLEVTIAARGEIASRDARLAS